MHIQIDGTHNREELLEQLATVFQLFLQRYQVHHFREVHLDFTLTDIDGQDVELVDNTTNQPFRNMRFCDHIPKEEATASPPPLQLVVNNAKDSK